MKHLPKPSIFLLVILMVSLLSIGCAANEIETADATSPPTATNTGLEASSTPTESPLLDNPTATPTSEIAVPEQPLTRYSLSSILDYDAHTLQVDQQIQYFNTTGSPLSEMLLIVEPNRYPGGFSLNSLAWSEGEPAADYQLDENQLLLPLDDPLPPGDSLEIHISFLLVLPNQNAPYGYTDRQTNLGDWYPYIPPFIPGEGWLVRPDAFLGEHLAYDMAEFIVEIQLTEAYSAAGGELIIAASSLPESETGFYRYQHAPARNFAWTVSDLYQEQETWAGDVLVRSYTFPFHPQADTPALEETAKALSIFSELFEPYPHAALTVVEADFLDGMEYDGLVFLSHAFYDYYTGGPQNNLTIIAAHEAAHQWWYGLVGNDQALEPWLDEALCTFSEILFYERAYPELVDWWWENRIYFHEPQGWVDSTIYEADGFYPYRDAVYLRGALFLGEVRELLGPEIFQDFLRSYLSRYRYRQINGDDFFNLLSEYTSTDISVLVNEYFSQR
jgi:hypothetical protein